MTELSYGPFISRGQAKADGLINYFTGIPCKYGHVSTRYVASGACQSCLAEKYKIDVDKTALKRAALVEQGPNISREQASGQNLTHYFTGIPCKQGHVSVRRTKDAGCLQCAVERQKLWCKENYDQKRTMDREYCARNKEAHRARSAKYQRENADQYRQYQNKYNRERHAVDPVFRLTKRLRCRLRDALRGRKSYSRGTEKMLGCTFEEAVTHLEKQFVDGMSWQNMDLWHIDHIRPVASFEDPADPACWHYTNLQPLWAEDNLRKSDAWEEAS